MEDDIIGDFVGTVQERFDRLVARVQALDLVEDEAKIAMLGVGPLEVLFHQGAEEALWPQIEELARSDARFRLALASAWAYSSPMYERRERLLKELSDGD